MSTTGKLKHKTGGVSARRPRVGEGMSGPVAMYDRRIPMKIDPERPIAPHGTPRDLMGRCGHCRGYVAADSVLEMVCWNCGRVAR